MLFLQEYGFPEPGALYPESVDLLPQIPQGQKTKEPPKQSLGDVCGIQIF